MSDTPTEAVNPAETEVFSNMANLFIELANRLLDPEEENLAEVASAFRHAAARFTAYETITRLGAYFNADIQGMPNPEEAQTQLVAKFVEQFQNMLDQNFAEYIEASAQATEQ